MAEYQKATDEVKSEDTKNKSGKERPSHRGFNLWAAFFGMFYYVFKGLWKKGLLLSTLTMMLLILVHIFFPRLSLATLSTAISVGLFGSMANRDVERKEQTGETMWKELPAVFNRGWLVVGLFVLTFLVYMATPTTPLADIEDTSTELVTEILHDHYDIPLEAVEVRIVEEVEGMENLYIGAATLSNEAIVQISIEYFPDTHYIEVFIPEEEILYLWGTI